MLRFVLAPLQLLLVVLSLGVASAGCALRGAIGSLASIGSILGPTLAPTPMRGLTGTLQNRPESVSATMPPQHPSRVDQVGAPPLQPVQGEQTLLVPLHVCSTSPDRDARRSHHHTGQALGPAELPATLPCGSPSVSTP